MSEPHGTEDSDDHPEEDPEDIGGGVGLGLGFIAGGLFCLLVVPDYLNASTGWATLWHIVGGLLGLAGVAGALVELDKVGSLHGLGYVGAAIIVAAPAGALHLLTQRGYVTGQIASSSRLATVIVIIFGLTGLGMGLGRLVSSMFTSTSGIGDGPNQLVLKIVGLLTALMGLVTASLNFFAE